MTARTHWSPGPAAWQDDLSPLPPSEWSFDRAAHLLAHAGFGGTPEEIQKLADAGLERAVESLVHYERVPNPKMQPFVESGLWDPSLNGFPDSRPDATDRAEQHGAAMGVSIKPGGNRPAQPVSDRFFYWLRATMLETRRLGYWWANRMLQTTHPVEQKMALLWHGHFATHENKVRDYRKMHQQIELFERGATGNLRDLTVQVAQNPAMLYFLDAQYNVKGAPNENFAREVMELFTMGVGNYTEMDVRECARAFTGWYFDDLAFKVDLGEARRRRENIPRPHRELRRRGRAEDHFRATGDGGVFRGEDLSLPRARRAVTRAAHEARHGAARRRLRGQAAADGDLHLEGLLQSGELRWAYQGPGRAHGRDDEAPRRCRRCPASPISISRRSRWASIC